MWCCLHLAYDLFLVLLHICLNAIYDETLLTWQSDICSIFHMVSTFHCIASNLVKCLLLSLHIIVLVISCHPFFITYSICRQSVYIELLFMCISHLSRLWKNQEWKQGLQSRQWYLLKHISRWLQGAPQRRIQRQMTSPISHLRCML